MRKNVNDYERLARVAVGLFFFFRKKRYIFLAPVMTGITGNCPLYTALGINTRGEEKTDQDYFGVQSPSEIAAGHPIVGVV